MDHEARLNACCMLDNELIDDALAAGVLPSWFSDQAEQAVWKKMVGRFREGKSIDTYWGDKLVEKITRAPSTRYSFNDILAIKSEFATVLEMLQKDYERSILSRLMANVSKRLATDDPQLLIKEFIEKLPWSKETRNDLESKEEIGRRILDRIDKGVECPTRYRQLDHYVWGIERGVLWTIGGATSNGKSTFAANLGYNVSRSSQSVTIFSSEMGTDDLRTRIATIDSGVNPLFHRLMGEERTAFKAGLQRTLDLPIEIYQTVSLPEIRMRIRRRESRLYIVDYIQLVDPVIKIDNEVKRLGFIVRGLKTLAKEYNVCIIATSQLRRGGEGEVPSTSWFRGSGEIEENTDIAIIMHYAYQQANRKEKEALEKKGKQGIINVEVQKNRVHGLTGLVKFEFDRETLRMKEIGGIEE